MTRETKAGLLMIAMLAGVFGFMVYKRLPPRSAALAQQDVPSAEETASTEKEDETRSNDPFLANVAEQRVPTETKVVPAVATIPAQIPDAEGNATISTAPGGDDRRPVRDPFEVDLSGQISRKASAPASREHSPGEKRPTRRAHGGVTAVAAETAPAALETAAAPDDFNPFDTAETEPAGKPESAGATASNTASNSETDFGPPSRTSVSQKLPTEEIALSEKDPFEGESKPTVTFEPPVANRSGNAQPDPLQQDSGAKDPFADNNLEVQKPQQSSTTSESPVLSFEDQPEAVPAGKSATVDDSFDQSPKPSEVPTLKIPSAPARPAENDERFGGFRPATPTTAAIPTISEVNPSIPESRAEPARRTTRPAPVTQIDEDFGTRQSARPLIAGDSYQVEPNDNYWSISRKKYGTGRYFMALAQHNSKLITDPRRMRPGVTISTPAAEELERAYSQLIPKPAPTNPVQTASASTATSGFGTGKYSVAPTEQGESEAGFFMAKDGAPMYCIGEEDTLSGIAQRHLGRSSRWVQILELNRDVLTDGNTLKIGTVLRLPADASQVDVVGTPRTFR